MNTKKFIEDLVEDGLDNNTIINFVEDLECKYLELLHTEIGFLVGLLVAVDSGASVRNTLKRRIEALKQ